MKKCSIMLLTIIMILSILGGCNFTSKKEAIGKWIDKDGHCLDIREGGSYKLEGDYGTGNWKYLDDNLTLEFTDFYGDTTETVVSENTFGKFIKLGNYGKFYKDSYPTINNIETDVFENITIDIGGASPFCYVSVNTDKLDEFLSEYVKFNIETDASSFKAGDTITVSANLYGDLAQQISPQTKDFVLDNTPIYITNTEDLDTNTLNKICENFIQSEINTHKQSEYGYTDFFYFDKNQEFISHDIIEYGLITRKPDALNEFNPKTNIYNTYYCLYEFEIANHNNGKTYYHIVEVLLTNICKTPDGEYKWYVHSEDITENNINGGCYDSVSQWASYGRYYDYYYSDSYDVSIIYYNKNFDGTKFE